MHERCTALLLVPTRLPFVSTFAFESMESSLLSLNGISLAGSTLFLLYFLRKYWNNESRPPLPPGPRGLPLVGSVYSTYKLSSFAISFEVKSDLLDFPRKQFVLTYLQWGEQYGPLTWVVVPGRKFLILNTYDAMRELLDKRGSNYIDRNQGVMISKLMSKFIRSKHFR